MIFFLFCLIFPFNVKLTVSPMHFVMIQVEKIVILEQLESSSFPYVGINGNHLTTFVSSKLNNCQSFWPIDLILVSKMLRIEFQIFLVIWVFLSVLYFSSHEEKTVQFYEILVIFLETLNIQMPITFLFFIKILSSLVCRLSSSCLIFYVIMVI